MAAHEKNYVDRREVGHETGFDMKNVRSLSMHTIVNSYYYMLASNMTNDKVACGTKSANIIFLQIFKGRFCSKTPFLLEKVWLKSAFKF